MKITMKFGNLKYTYDGDSSDLLNCMNFLGGALTKYNSEFLKTLYKSNSNIHIKKQESGKAADDPDMMRANGHDIYNYAARYGLANCQIQAVLKLDGRIDFDLLSRAVRLSVDTQPVFGCRFIENEPPYWKRLEDLDAVQFCSIEETTDSDGAVRRFLESTLDMDHDPMVKILLVRSEQHDTLCIKNNHSCCDGTGTKEYVHLLSEIYSIIDQDKGLFIVKPAKRTRKDQDRMFSQLGISDPEREWIPGSEITRATWPFPWSQIQTDISRIAVERLETGQMNELVLYSKSKNVTINDLVLTAYYRVMNELTKPPSGELMEIPLTIDLRRYLPDHRTEAIRNFSGSEFTRFTMIRGESFGETLPRIAAMMNDIKRNRPGLQSAIGLERLEKLTFKETLDYYRGISQWPVSCPDKCAPVLSNLGVVSDSLLHFGKYTVTDAYIVPPVVRAPGLLLMISTYNGIMTLAAGFYEASIPHGYISTLLNEIKTELTQGCRT